VTARFTVALLIAAPEEGAGLVQGTALT